MTHVAHYFLFELAGAEHAHVILGADCAHFTQTKETHSSKQSASCSNLSSTMSEFDALRARLGPSVRAARRRCHSPTQGEAAEQLEAAPRVCRLTSLGNTVLRNFSSRSRRTILRRHLRSLRLRDNVAARECGTFAVNKYTGYVWIGPVLLWVSSKQWRVQEVTGACDVRIQWMRRDGTYMQSSLIYDGPTLIHPHSRKGHVYTISVACVQRCFQKAVSSLDCALVEYWRPHHKIIYATCDTDNTEHKVVAHVNSTNDLSCAVCHCKFGRSTEALCAHLHVSPNLSFHTYK